MQRPASKALKTLARLAAVLLSVGVLTWVVGFAVFMYEMANYPDNATIQSAFDWMNLGGSLTGFGVLFLVGYLAASAVGDFIAAASSVERDSSHQL